MARPMFVLNDTEPPPGADGGSKAVRPHTHSNPRCTVVRLPEDQKISGGVASKDSAALVEWLHGTGKGAYAQHFASAGIDGSILCDPATTAPLLIEAVPGLPFIIATAILRQAAAEA